MESQDFEYESLQIPNVNENIKLSEKEIQEQLDYIKKNNSNQICECNDLEPNDKDESGNDIFIFENGEMIYINSQQADKD